MISAPVWRTLSGIIALTVAAVPTGMKAGVRISPRCVWITPVRAAPSTAFTVGKKDVTQTGATNSRCENQPGREPLRQSREPAAQTQDPNLCRDLHISEQQKRQPDHGEPGAGNSQEIGNPGVDRVPQDD